LTFRWLEHTGEAELSIEDESAEAVFADALEALSELLGEEEPTGDRLTQEVSVSAPDLPALLAGWLEELVYLAETKGLIPERVVSIELSGTALDAVVAGRRSAPQSLVKGVTYHRLAMERDNGGWRAHVVFDV
jgi:SHS2 domain-containing protein